MWNNFHVRRLDELIKLEAQALLRANSTLQNIIESADIAKTSPNDSREEHFLKSLLEMLRGVDEFLENLNMPMSAIAVRKVFMMADQKNISKENYYFGISRAAFLAKGRIEDEVSLVEFYHINGSNSDLIRRGRIVFGTEVLSAFSDALYDIEEAVVCIGLSRNTAAVFHLMRVMEVAVSKLCVKCGATFEDKNGKPLTWGVLESNIRDKIARQPHDEKSRWEELVAHLTGVRLSCRNDTMHPVRKYTDEEARAVFENVRAFMRDAASFV